MASFVCGVLASVAVALAFAYPVPLTVGFATWFVLNALLAIGQDLRADR